MRSDVYLCEEGELAKFLLEDVLCGLEDDPFLAALTLPAVLNGSVKFVDGSPTLFFKDVSPTARTAPI